MNKAILIGGLGRDPEVRSTGSGSRVVTFSVATKESWRDRNTGERKERTEWHNVVCWNEGLGKVAESYLKKGSKVAIEGQIQTREYTDKDGNQRKVTEIVIPQFGGSLEMLDSRKDDDAPKPAARSNGARASLSDDLNDSVPFAPEWR